MKHTFDTIKNLTGVLLLLFFIGCTQQETTDTAGEEPPMEVKQHSLGGAPPPPAPAPKPVAEKGLIKLTDGNFQSTALGADKLVVADFWATWCRPCRMLDPVVAELAKEYEGRVIFGKVDVDHNRGVASSYSISSIPTLLFIKDGKVIDKVVGAVGKEAIVTKLEKNI